MLPMQPMGGDIFQLQKGCHFLIAMTERFFTTEDFYHKIWGAVSVMMEGVYRVGQSSG
jgi:hypothetical protein